MPKIWHISSVYRLYVITHADHFGLVHKAPFLDSLLFKKQKIIMNIFLNGKEVTDSRMSVKNIDSNEFVLPTGHFDCKI